MKKLLWILSKFDHKSLIALGIMIFLDFDMIMAWKQYYNAHPGHLFRDPLSVGLWVYMTILLCWNIDIRRDIARIIAGLIGGLVIESWGTFSEVWTYRSQERPPLWIIPAWPVAALAIDRMNRAASYLLPKGDMKILWWITMPAFILYMTHFSYHHGNHIATILIFISMIVIISIPGEPRQDMCLMLGGSLLGIFIEYYGTSRHVWTYYTHEIPPYVSIFAHGFASVAFQRAAAILDNRMPTWENIKNFIKSPKISKKI